MALHPSELTWSQYLAGELSLYRTLHLRLHLATCASCRDAKRTIDRERSAYDAMPERGSELERLTRAAGRSRFGRRRAWWPVLVAAPATAAMAAALLFFFGPVSTPDGAQDLSPKGSDTFVLERQRPGGEIETVGATCAPGDRLRGRLGTAKGFALVIGIDSAGVAQTIYPFGGKASVPVSVSPAWTAGSFVLDDRLGRERFVAIYSDRPLDAAVVTDALLDPSGKRLPADASLVEASCEKIRP